VPTLGENCKVSNVSGKKTMEDSIFKYRGKDLNYGVKWAREGRQLKTRGTLIVSGP